MIEQRLDRGIATRSHAIRTCVNGVVYGTEEEVARSGCGLVRRGLRIGINRKSGIIRHYGELIASYIRRRSGEPIVKKTRLN